MYFERKFVFPCFILNSNIYLTTRFFGSLSDQPPETEIRDRQVKSVHLVPAHPEIGPPVTKGTYPTSPTFSVRILFLFPFKQNSLSEVGGSRRIEILQTLLTKSR
jgi:hypothetical protein